MNTVLSSLLFLLPLVLPPVSAPDQDSFEPPPPKEHAEHQDQPPRHMQPGAHPQPPGPPMGEDRRGRADVERGDRRGPGPRAPWVPLMRVLGEHRPELAGRLERMRQHDPDLFERVLMEAFLPRIERALDEAEADIKRRGPQRPGRPDEPRGPEDGPRGQRPPGPAAHEREFERHLRELHERQEEFERRTHELVEKIQRLREEDAEPEAREALQHELTGVVNEQFEVRTELREMEMQRIERELERLRVVIERMRHEFERRQQEREKIIERRVRHLMGNDFGDW
ncbi:MAG: hypothetical protein ABIG44_08150 [Planctomycetota bacterium]